MVTNAAEWFGLFENPGSAHLNYLRQPDNGRIIDVIICGMENDRLAPC